MATSFDQTTLVSVYFWVEPGCFLSRSFTLVPVAAPLCRRFPVLLSLVVVLLILVPLVLWDEQTRNETRRWRALLKDYVGFDCVWMPGVQVTLKA